MIIKMNIAFIKVCIKYKVFFYFLLKRGHIVRKMLLLICINNIVNMLFLTVVDSFTGK